MEYTPITISSSNESEQLEYCLVENTPSTISSTSQRVPVSEERKKHLFERTVSSTSLPTDQKVTNWINDHRNAGIFENRICIASGNKMTDGAGGCTARGAVPVTSEFVESDADEADNSMVNVSESIILVRCDFDKTSDLCTTTTNANKASNRVVSFTNVKNKDKSPNKNSISSTKTEPIVNGTLKSSTNNSANNILVIPDKCVNPSPLSSRRSSSMCPKSGHSETSSDVNEVPLSPDSQKKELCSYLQLMHPADTKKILQIQNRRSTRVKNLSLMQEKKALERQLKVGELENGRRTSEEDTVSYPAMKSFSDLKLNSPRKSLLSYKAKKATTVKNYADLPFTFPFPASELFNKVENFDEAMEHFVSAMKPNKDKENNCRVLVNGDKIKTNVLVKNKENVNKNKFKQQRKSLLNVRNTRKIKIKLRTPSKKYASASGKSLRSTGKLKNVGIKKLLLMQHEIRNKISTNKFRNRSKTKKVKPQKVAVLTPSAIAKPKMEDKLHSCKIISMRLGNKTQDIDLVNFMDDMKDFDKLSSEHKRCLLESRVFPKIPSKILASSYADSPQSDVSPLHGFNKNDREKVEQFCEFYKDWSKTPLGGEIKPSPPAKKTKNPIELLSEIEDAFNKTCEDHHELYSMECHNNRNELSPSESTERIGEQMEADSTEKPDEQQEVEAEDSSVDDDDNDVSCLTSDHDYANLERDVADPETPDQTCSIPKMCYEEVSPAEISNNKYEYLPFHKRDEIKSLHRSLTYPKRKLYMSVDPNCSPQSWDLDSHKSKLDKKNQSHSIYISKDNGVVLNAFYIDYNLILCQEYVVSFWTQTALGNVLGGQNMWIPKGHVQRLVLNNKCIQKESMEMVISMENNVAYVELWTKEHKSDIREGPVADVFATVYFWKQRQNGLNKKVIQLENIKGFADDVQYVVSRYSSKIIVSWHSVTDSKNTFIHSYQLAEDYQTVANIYEIEPVDHYVSSLHNIEDCDTLLMGCGENKITLWNLEYGYIVATIELTDIKSPLSTLWVKSDRGFLFTLQQCVDRELRLIAINGINLSWKRLASYNPPSRFDRLRGVCIENGVLVSFYDQGILCWNAQTGEPVVEEQQNETEYIPSGKYVIMIINNQIIVRHALTHLITADDS